MTQLANNALIYGRDEAGYNYVGTLQMVAKAYESVSNYQEVMVIRAQWYSNPKHGIEWRALPVSEVNRNRIILASTVRECSGQPRHDTRLPKGYHFL